ncbi:26273_t:CDS:2 [Dentiscutata erythropus]|uniref:26273_t:CDS:1 n=1 Tax=Dentiscutata erythropus TaxID=1348616 RepID=A0A9N9G007_9GLOM|nr:26273_t:CDS:2 [Dentiscutata erythropus]
MYSDRKLSRLPLHLSIEQKQLSKLASLPRNPIRTTQNLLITDERVLRRRCNWEPEFAKSVQKKCAQWIAPKNCTALDLLKDTHKETKEPFMSTSLPELDVALGGGIPCSSLTEIVGPTNFGKTQFCLTLSILATLPVSMNGLGGGTCYISTQGTFPAERLMEIAKYRFPYLFGDENPQCQDNLKKMTDAIHLMKAKSSKELANILENFQEFIIEKNIRLLIIDSFGALIKKEFIGKKDSLDKRSRLLVKFAAWLKFLSESFNMPTIVTNQVISFNNIREALTDLTNESDSGIKPALGNTWSHAVNTRLMMDYCDINPVIMLLNPDVPRNLRKIRVEKSPIGARKTFYFTIERKGIVNFDLKNVIDNMRNCNQDRTSDIKRLKIDEDE